MRSTGDLRFGERKARAWPQQSVICRKVCQRRAKSARGDRYAGRAAKFCDSSALKCTPRKDKTSQMRQGAAFTVLAICAGAMMLSACGHGGGPGGPRFARHGGPGDGPGGPETAGPPEGAQLKNFDLDGDGCLTRDELDRALHAEFAKYDMDRNGTLSAAETRPLNDQRRKEGSVLSPAFDWNADSRVDFKEFANQWLSLFDRLDADGDGSLTEHEMTRPSMGPPGGPGARGRVHHRR